VVLSVFRKIIFSQKIYKIRAWKMEEGRSKNKDKRIETKKEWNRKKRNMENGEVNSEKEIMNRRQKSEARGQKMGNE